MCANLAAPLDIDVVVHPATDLTYASPVLEGLALLLGEHAVRYSTAGFPPSFSGGRVMALYPAADPAARLFLGFADQTQVNPAGREWATVYGMVNVDPLPLRDGTDPSAVVPIGPTFGVRLSSDRLTAHHLASTWRWAAEGRHTEPRRRRRAWTAYERSRALAVHQRTRLRAHQYVARPSDPDFLFYAASTYPQFPEVNAPRVDFVRACTRSPGLVFEGGFVPHPRVPVPGVGPTVARRYPASEYLSKLGRSVAAFNNPAVHGCLGWKLGEQLAMGKAIISLPIDRPLPAPLHHGEHLHVVDGSPASFDEAIARLRTDHDYRHHLEVNARRWYDEHVAPARLATRVLTLITTRSPAS